jgi:hypothetical protein
MTDHPSIETHSSTISNQHRALAAITLGYAGEISTRGVLIWRERVLPKNKKSRFRGGGSFYNLFLLPFKQLSWPSSAPPSAFSSSLKCAFWQQRSGACVPAGRDHPRRAEPAMTLEEPR